MILFLSVLSFLFSADIQSDDLTIQQVRKLYAKAAEEEADCEYLLERLPKYDETSNETFKAYRACATMVMAKHAWLPMSKLSLFSEGQEYLEQAVKADPNNLEIRFLRFSIQSEAPSFLGYNDSIDDDKRILLTSLDRVKDKKLQMRIVDYLKASDELTSEEKQGIKI